MTFAPAVKKKQKFRIALEASAGGGKTYSALTFCQILGGRTAVIDSEHGSASLYADKFKFDTVSLEEHSLDTYIRTINEASKLGYENLIIDSLSHAWAGKGGALEEVDRMGGNKFANGWKTVTPKHHRLIDAILAYPGHVVATLRTKADYVIEDQNGKKVPRKIGTAPVAREGLDYEFSLVASLSNSTFSITKSRVSTFPVGTTIPFEGTEKFITQLKSWLESGEEQSKRDLLAADIRRATTPEELEILSNLVRNLPDADRDYLRPVYTAKRDSFVQG